jgi:hypothetical protein
MTALVEAENLFLAGFAPELVEGEIYEPHFPVTSREGFRGNV